MKLVLALCLVAGTAAAHGTENHTAAVVASGPEATPFPIAIGGPFTLTDQYGQTRTQIDPAGHLQLLFFGYANCQEICSAALPQMAEVAAALTARGVAVTPVMITVDPVRDTGPTMQAVLAKVSRNFIGLTGDPATLSQVYIAFSIESSLVFEAPTGPVYAHGSLIYLLDSAGRVLTLLPPVLSSDQMIDVVVGYAAKR